MTTTWPEVPLGEVAEFVRGITFKPADVEPLGTPGSIACMRTANVQAELDLDDVWAVPERFCRRDEQRLRRGDLLVSTANSWNLVGKCAWVGDLPWPSTFGGFVSALRPASSALDSRYLYRWFASPRIQATLRSYGRRTTSISNLSLDQCRAMRMPLPPIEEQRRIAAVLDQADALRAKRQASLAMVGSLNESMFLEMFGDPAANPRGWPSAPLATLCSISGEYGAAVPSAPLAGDDPRYVRITDIGEDGYLSDDPVAPAGDPSKWRRFKLAPGDLLFARSGATVGKTYLHGPVDREHVFAGYLIRFRPNPSQVNPAFVYQFTRTAAYRRWVENRQRAVAQPNINAKQYGLDLRIPVPPVEMQNEFARRIARSDRHQATLGASQAALGELFASLQQRAFAGQL